MKDFKITGNKRTLPNCNSGFKLAVVSQIEKGNENGE